MIRLVLVRTKPGLVVMCIYPHGSRVFLTNKIVDQWNHLPTYVVTADNVNLFKSRLDSYWDMIGYGQLRTKAIGLLIIFLVKMSIV